MGKRGNKGFSGGRGRGRGRDGGGRGGSGAGRGYGPRAGARSTLTAEDKHNEKFERYYNELRIVDEDERDAFWNSLRSDLPNSFRFAGSRGHALTVQKRLIEHYIPDITSVRYDGELVKPPTPVTWYPDQLAWSMTTPKNVIRKFLPFKSFQKFLVSENSVGNITRQELVSMIPPLMMGVKPGMTVLDLCAAPGSKSGQLIEMIHDGEESRVRRMLEKSTEKEGRELSTVGLVLDAEERQAATEEDWSDNGRSTGLLIANDVEYRRAQMLVHQVKRLNSPNIIVMNHDATLFPSIKLRSKSGTKYLKFDRILADVPCSGDGTCRKNPEAWTKWIPGNALGLYITQVRILVRALQMLKVGGRVVYSTCSMNPVENEAVVASAIDRCGGFENVKIMDCTKFTPGLQRRSGLTDWKVMDKAGRIWNSWEEVCQAKEAHGEQNFGRLVEGMFKPKEQLPLQHCVRIYPHLQDTGAFFIVVLEKQTEIKARPESESKKTKSTALLTSEVNEIERNLTGKEDLIERVDGIDSIMPPQTEEKEDLDYRNPSPVAGQNEEIAPSENVIPQKRALEDEAVTVAAATKRVRVMKGADDPALAGSDDRQGHWPLSGPAGIARHGPAPSETPLADVPIKRKTNQMHEEPFKYLPSNHEELVQIYAFYKLSQRFPRDRFMVRNATGQPVKAIYYTSGLAGEILTENEGKGMKFVHCGVKMFMKQDVQGQQDACKWRIQSEGLPIVEAWVGEERVVRLWKRETLRKLLIEMFPKVGQDGWRELGEIGERVRDVSMGCCVLRVEPRMGEEDGFNERLVLPLWKGIASINLMLPKEERKAMLLRLYNDDSPLVDHSKERFGYREPAEDSDSVALRQVGDTETINDEEDGGVSLNGTEQDQTLQNGNAAAINCNLTSGDAVEQAEPTLVA